MNLHVAYWDLQQFILPHVDNSWPRVDAVLGAVARDAIIANPLRYVYESITGFITLHGSSLPYWSNIGSIGVSHVLGYPAYCRTLGAFKTCKPITPLGGIIPFWNTYIAFSNWIHKNVFAVAASIVGIPSVLYALTKPGKLRLVRQPTSSVSCPSP